MSPELIDARRAIFTDYCNQRDRIKLAAGRQTLNLSPDHEGRVLALARHAHHRREQERDAIWFRRFFMEVDQWMDNVKVASWPELRRRWSM